MTLGTYGTIMGIAVGVIAVAYIVLQIVSRRKRK